jgi:hypothetical protein
MERWIETEDGRKCCSESCYKKTLPMCDICGNRMEQWTETEDGRKYCSEICLQTSYYKCCTCGKPMKEWYMDKNGNKSCTSCHHKELPKCDICGNTMRKWLETKEGLKFCSEECSNNYGITINQNFKQYDLAISYASEDRKIAKHIAAKLNNLGYIVYYDEDEKVNMLGRDLYKYLYDLYRKKPRYCLIIISAHYAKKKWTQVELVAALSRRASEEDYYIIPYRLDNTELSGFPKDIGGIDWNTPIDEAIDLLDNKLRK